VDIKKIKPVEKIIKRKIVKEMEYRENVFLRVIRISIQSIIKGLLWVLDAIFALREKIGALLFNWKIESENPKISVRDMRVPIESKGKKPGEEIDCRDFSDLTEQATCKMHGKKLQASRWTELKFSLIRHFEKIKNYFVKLRENENRVKLFGLVALVGRTIKNFDCQGLVMKVKKFKFYDVQEWFSRHRLFVKRFSAVTIILVIVAVGFFRNQFFSQGATHYFKQISWSGGADTSAIAQHVYGTSNELTDKNSTWTKFSAKDAAIEITATGVNLQNSTGSVQKTNDVDFSAGTHTNSVVAGNGAEAKVELGKEVIKVISGGQFSLGLKSDGTVWAWGRNNYGQFGNGTKTNSLVPVPVSNLTGVIDISVGYYNAFALKSDGTVWAWGYNYYGQLGNGTQTDSLVPVPVSNLTGVIAISGGFDNTSVLKSDGTVWAWGRNIYGQLGNGTNISSNVPVPVSNLTGVIAISGGYYNILALKSDGTVWAWGSNNFGQLGNGTQIDSNVPVPVSNLTGVIAISSSKLSASFALKSDGTVWAWGYGYLGQLGIGGGSNYNVPTLISNLTGVSAIAGGEYNACALKSDGTVWAWGTNSFGQLGNGTNINSNVPVPVSNLTDVIAISMGGVSSLALKSDSTIWAWGDSNYGQFGNGTEYTSSNVPLQTPVNLGLVYKTSGNFTSSTMAMADLTGNVGQKASFSDFSWNGTKPSGTNVSVDFRFGDTVSPDGTWTSWQNNATGGIFSLIGNAGKYFQYRINLTGNGLTTSSLADTTLNYVYYPTTAKTLISSPYDMSAPSSISAISWDENSASLPAGTTMQLSLRAVAPTAMENTETMAEMKTKLDALGSGGWQDVTSASAGCTKSDVAHPTIVTCDLTSNNTLNPSLLGGIGNRMFQYKITLGSSGDETPVLSGTNGVTVTYVVNNMPEFDTAAGEAVIAVQLTEDEVIADANVSNKASKVVKINYSIRDTDSELGNFTAGYVTPSFQYSTNGGSSWSSDISSANLTMIVPSGSSGSLLDVNSDGKIDNSVATGLNKDNFTKYVAYFDVSAQLPETYNNNNFQVRVTINDNEPANNRKTVVANTNQSFSIDTKKPNSPKISMDRSVDSNQLAIEVTEDTAVGMKYALNENAAELLVDANGVETVSAVNCDFASPSWNNFTGSPMALNLSNNSGAIKGACVLFKDKYGNVSDNSNNYVVSPRTPKSFQFIDLSNPDAGTGYADSSVYRVYFTWNRTTQGLAGGYDGNDGTPFTEYDIYTCSTGLIDPTIEDSNNLNIAPCNPNVLEKAETDILTNFYLKGSGLDGQHKFCYNMRLKNENPDSAGGGDYSAWSEPAGASYLSNTKCIVPGTGMSSISNKEVSIVFDADSNVNVPANKIFTNQATINWKTVNASKPTESLITNEGVRWREKNGADPTWIAYDLPEKFAFGEHSITIPGSLNPNTEYEYQIYSEAPWGKSDTKQGTVPATFTTKNGPIIKNVEIPAEDLGNYSAKVTWSTQDAGGNPASASSVLYYSTAINASGDLVTPQTGNCDAGSVATHTCELTDLSPINTYYFYVYSAYDLVADPNAYNADTNKGAYYSLTTKNDETPPIITANVGNPVVLTDTQAALSMTTNEKTKTWIIYGKTSNPTGFAPIVKTPYNPGDALLNPYIAFTADASFSTSHALTINAMEANTTYYYRLVAEDISGNVNFSAETSFTTKQVQTAHVPLKYVVDKDVSPVVSQTSQTEAIITYNAGTESRSWICYSQSPTISDADLDGRVGSPTGNCVSFDKIGYDDSFAVNSKDTKLHSYKITGLSPGTTYYFRMKIFDSVDAIDFYRTGEVSGATTAAPIVYPDLTDPGALQILQVSDTTILAQFPQTNTYANSRLCYSTDSNVVYDDACVNGIVVPTAKTHYYYITGLSPTTIYYLKAKISDNQTPAIAFPHAASAETTSPPVTIDPLTVPGTLEVLQASDTTILAQISAPTNTYAISKLCYSTSPIADGDIDTCAQNISLPATKVHYYYITELAQNTPYYLKAKISDNENPGNYFIRDIVNPVATTYSQLNHTALASVSPAPQTITISQKSDQQVIATINAGTEVTSKVCYVEESGSTDVISNVSTCVAGGITDQIASNTRIHYYKLDSLKAETQYHIKIELTDGVTGDVVETNELSFTTLQKQISHTPLSKVIEAAGGLAGLPVIPQWAGTEAIITYNAGTNVNSELCYRESVNGSDLSINDTFTDCIGVNKTIADSALHAYHISGLTPGKKYLVEIKLTDSNDVNGATYSIHTGTEEFTTPIYSPPSLTTISPIVIKQFSDTEAVAYLTADVNANAKLCYSAASISDGSLNACVGNDGSGNNGAGGVLTNLGGASKMQMFHLVGLNPDSTYFVRARVVSEEVPTDILDSTENQFTTEKILISVSTLSDPGALEVVQVSDFAILAKLPAANTYAISRLCYNPEVDVLDGDIDSGTGTCATHIDVSASKNHVYYVPGLTQNTNYYLKAKIEDSAYVGTSFIDVPVTVPVKTLHTPATHAALSIVNPQAKTITISNISDKEALAKIDAKTDVKSELCLVQSPVDTLDVISDVSGCAIGIKKVINSNNNWQYYNLDSLAPDTKYHVKIKFTDSIDANDTLETDEIIFTTLSKQLTHAPLSTIKNSGNVGLPEITQLSGTEATITYDAGTNVKSEVCYRESANAGDLSIANGFTDCISTQTIADSVMHPYHLTGLTEGSTYLVEIKLTDVNDIGGATYDINTGTEKFTTPAYTPPSLGLLSPIVVKQWSDTEAVAYLTADVNANAKLCYSTTSIADGNLNTCVGNDSSGNNGNGGVVDNLGGNSKMQTFHLTGLNPNNTYYLRARVTNGEVMSNSLDSTETSFNTKLIQENHILLTNASYDASMTISPSDDSAIITFNAGTGSDSKLCIANAPGIDMATCSAVVPQVSNSKIHSYVVAGLEANKTYYAKMELTDATDVSNKIVLSEQQFDTLPIQVGHTPLSAITNLPAYPTATTISGTAAIITYDSKTNVQSEFCYKDFSDGVEINATMSNCTMLDSQTVADSVLHAYVLDAAHNSALTPGIAYHTRMRLTDFHDVNGATEVVYTGIGSFTTPITVAPVLNNPGIPEVVQISDKEAIIKLATTNTDATSKLCYGAASISDAEVNNNTCVNFISIDGATKTHYYHLVGLTQETNYYVKSKVVNIEDSSNAFVSDGTIDNAGSVVNYFTTKKTQVDSAGALASISTPVAGDITVGYNFAVVNWMTDQPADQTLNCGKVSSSYTSTANEFIHLNTLHSLKIAGLDAETKYYCKVTSEDALGNALSSGEFDFTTTKNTTISHAPITGISSIAIPAELISDEHAVVTFKTDQPAICYAKLTTSQGSYTNPNIIQEDGYLQEKYNLAHSISFIGLIPTTNYYFNLYCHDDLFADEGSLEVSSENESNFKTLEKLYTLGGLNLDNTKPEISGVKVSSITGESVLVSWTTNEKASSSVRFGTLTIDESMAGNSFVNKDVANYVTAHEVLVSNLVPSTKYVFAVSSADVAGNIGSSSESSFTTDSPSALSSIKVTSTAIDRATVTWNTANPTSSTVEYGITTEYGQTKSDASLVKEHSISLSDLESGKEYHFRVRGKDKNGNVYSSSDYTFEPKSPPQISDIEIDDITEHGATIKFQTNIDTDSLVVYTDKDDDKNTGSQGDPNMTQSHAVELKDLEPGKTFKIRIKVRDADGNEAEEIGKEFTVGKDVNAPKIDQVKTDSALAQNDKVQTIISWTTDEPSTTAIIYQEGKTGEEKEVKINNSLTNSHVAVITTFKSGVVYYFKVKSIDQSNNEAISNDFALLTPRKKENIIQIIVGNFQDIFGWIKMN
jgi:alpha-tubulin suppressor-like RCC1 family protein